MSTMKRKALKVPKTPIGEHLRKIASAYKGERAEGIVQAASILEAEVHRTGVEPALLFFPKPPTSAELGLEHAPPADPLVRLERVAGRLEELAADLAAFVRDAPRGGRELPTILSDPHPAEVQANVRANGDPSFAYAREPPKQEPVEELDPGDVLEDAADHNAPNREKGERVVLTAIVQAGSHEATRRWISVLTGYKSRTITTYTSRLRSKGYLQAHDLVVSEEGRAWLGAYKPLPLGKALREHWLAKLPAGERDLFVEFIRVPNASITHRELLDRTRYAARTVTTYLSRLGSRQLIVRARRGYTAAPELFT